MTQDDDVILPPRIMRGATCIGMTRDRSALLFTSPHNGQIKVFVSTNGDPFMYEYTIWDDNTRHTMSYIGPHGDPRKDDPVEGSLDFW